MVCVCLYNPNGLEQSEAGGLLRKYWSLQNPTMTTPLQGGLKISSGVPTVLLRLIYFSQEFLDGGRGVNLVTEHPDPGRW